MNPSDAAGATLIAAALGASYALLHSGKDTLSMRAGATWPRRAFVIYFGLHFLRVLPKCVDPLSRYADRVRSR